ncbi:MAG TPA: Re/Si-specific NAD(P)(+) transhydrogenase subunit alpha [Actinomycetes bacterium]|nr:Re/Si-specific NAD(P)(+) transhydrogenase subunit alpha [Actinomycetes bacterium]
MPNPASGQDQRRAATVGVVREAMAGEWRVALTPAVVPALTRAGCQVVVESSAGLAAGATDDAYRERGATVVEREEALGADVLLAVRPPGTTGHAGQADLERLRADQVVIGLCDPLSAPDGVRAMAERKLTVFALELLPRITRAQAMDVLSSQATVAGYKATVLAAGALAKMFPLLTTAAGTIAPARVLVVGAGVAGLQAIATARRLGAVVEAYDLRPAVKEQIESLGARFVELPLEAGDAEAGGGYAQEMDADFYRRQREAMTAVVAANDVVITTALVPGRRAPVLVTADMVAAMGPGSVVIDLAAAQGGNCELTRPDETVTVGGVTVLGPTNLPATVPAHASQMYAKNVSAFLLHLLRDGRPELDLEDEITRETLVAADGRVTHPRVRDALGLDTTEVADGQ